MHVARLFSQAASRGPVPFAYVPSPLVIGRDRDRAHVDETETGGDVD
jgi:hypothetical protein